ncbi:MAG: Lrp/AsnC family transcriptional regulator [Spirochaetales bacterium]|nr:Lrp/AsnC family transcriptional regulator [Spirochaetales bacterium]
MKFDDTNLAIIKHLKDGRKSFAAIAQELDVTENTVRSRVTRMMDEGVLEIVGLVNPQQIPGHRSVIIGIKLSTPKLYTKGQEFCSLKGVVNVMLVTGKYDLIVEVLLNENFGLLDFYEEEFSKIDGIQNMETFVVVKNFHHRVPYAL